MITEIVKAFDESRDALLDRLPGDVRTYRDLFSVTLEEINKHLPERQTFVRLRSVVWTTASI